MSEVIQYQSEGLNTDYVVMTSLYYPIIWLTFTTCCEVFFQITSIPTVVNAFFITHKTERNTLSIPAGEVWLTATLGLVETWKET